LPYILFITFPKEGIGKQEYLHPFNLKNDPDRRESSALHVGVEIIIISAVVNLFKFSISYKHSIRLKGVIMKIEFTKNEMRILIELLYFGEFIFDTSSEAHPEKKEKYDNLLQKIYKIASQNGMTDILKPLENKIYPTPEFEEDEFITGVIDAYENETFWHELMFMLSQRDILEKIPEEEYLKLELTEQIKLQAEHEETYHEEFTKNGIRNLKILSSDLSFLKKK
jgi:hypothetical protein